MGYRYHREILGRWPLSRHPDLVARSEAFVQRHGGKSVFLARFTPGVRAFVLLVVGVLRMPVRRFYAANLLSALAWAPSHVLPGIFVGALMGLAGGAATGRLAALLVVVVAALWAAGRIVRYALRQGMPLVAAGLERLRAKADGRDSGVRWLVRTDVAIYRIFQDLRTPWGDAAMIAITELGATLSSVR